MCPHVSVSVPFHYMCRVAQYEDQDEDQPEFKAAKRVESADLLAKLKVKSRMAHILRMKSEMHHQHDRACHPGI